MNPIPNNHGTTTLLPFRPAPASVSLEQLLTVKEAARRLRVGTRAVYRYMRERQFPIVRLNARTVRIPVAALDAWLHSRVERGQTLGEDPE